MTQQACEVDDITSFCTHTYWSLKRWSDLSMVKELISGGSEGSHLHHRQVKILCAAVLAWPQTVTRLFMDGLVGKLPSPRETWCTARDMQFSAGSCGQGLNNSRAVNQGWAQVTRPWSWARSYYNKRLTLNTLKHFTSPYFSTVLLCIFKLFVISPYKLPGHPQTLTLRDTQTGTVTCHLCSQSPCTHV